MVSLIHGHERPGKCIRLQTICPHLRSDCFWIAHRSLSRRISTKKTPTTEHPKPFFGFKRATFESGSRLWLLEASQPVRSRHTTLRVNVFELEAPFFGFTVTVTLQVPTFKPLIVVPVTLQYFADEGTTLNDTVEPKGMANFA